MGGVFLWNKFDFVFALHRITTHSHLLMLLDVDQCCDAIKNYMTENDIERFINKWFLALLATKFQQNSSPNFFFLFIWCQISSLISSYEAENWVSFKLFTHNTRFFSDFATERIETRISLIFEWFHLRVRWQITRSSLCSITYYNQFCAYFVIINFKSYRHWTKWCKNNWTHLFTRANASVNFWQF